MRIINNLDHAQKLFLGKNRRSQNKHKDKSISETVQTILNQVFSQGDTALINLSKKYDGISLEQINIPQSLIDESIKSLNDEIKNAIKFSFDRISQFHEQNTYKSWFNKEEGYGENFTAIEKVGVYIPTNLVSTVLMTVIPAKIAGVKDIYITTPPNDSGIPNSEILYASKLTGVTNVFPIGGSQAIAALAFGTETIPKVDLICGPGNTYVTEAKRQVFGTVGIDGIYGPTETLIIADHSANPTLCAADLIAQAEHDYEARPILITTSPKLAENIKKEIYIRLSNLPREEIAKKSIENNGAIIIVDDNEQMINFSNSFAPEHVSLVTQNPEDVLDKIQNAGAIFMGEFSHEVLGDYIAGPSHVMPTGGAARFSSGISTRTFMKSSPVINLSQSTVNQISHSASVLSKSEGLHGHSNAAEIRLDIEKF